VDFEDEMIRRGGVSRDAVKAQYRDLLITAEKTGKKRLRDYPSPSEVVANWIEGIVKQIGGHEREAEKRGLESVFSIRGAHRTLPFLHVDCLNCTLRAAGKGIASAAGFVEAFSSWTLEQTAEALKREWAESWATGRHQTSGVSAGDETVAVWFSPLNKGLNQHKTGGDLVSKYLNHHHSAPADTVRDWCNQVREELLKKDLPVLFAWRYHLLGKSGRERPPGGVTAGGRTQP
jgi:hypothetical protein